MNKETAASTEELRGKESREREKDRNKNDRQRNDYAEAPRSRPAPPTFRC